MAQTLTQTQIIRSLGQALEWFEKEIGWGVPAGELRHLTGRIGELYVAMITRGQMALATNQQGYDVVSFEGEYISVKTITTSTHVSFASSTIAIATRVIILRLVIDGDDIAIEEVFDGPTAEIQAKGLQVGDKIRVTIPTAGFSEPTQSARATRRVLSTEEQQRLKTTGQAVFGNYRIVQYENSTILVEANGVVQDSAYPVLSAIAMETGVDLLNSNGNKKNTRTLGADIIRALKAVG